MVATDSANRSTTAELANARFIDLVTFRKTGARVGTPVLFAVDGDHVLVRTAHDAGKLKRIRLDSNVEIAPSDWRGRRLGRGLPAQARILGPDAVASTLGLLHARYPITGPVFSAMRRLRRKGNVIVDITLDPLPDPGASA
jgi:uncharacterized protein